MRVDDQLSSKSIDYMASMNRVFQTLGGLLRRRLGPPQEWLNPWEALLRDEDSVELLSNPLAN